MFLKYFQPLNPNIGVDQAEFYSNRSFSAVFSCFGISPDMIIRIETEQGEVAERRIKSSLFVSNQPKSLDAVAPVIFRCDNFGHKIESPSRKGSIHDTPSDAFQLITSKSTFRDV